MPRNKTVLTGHLNSIQNSTQILLTLSECISIVFHLYFSLHLLNTSKEKIHQVHTISATSKPSNFKYPDKKLFKLFQNTNQNDTVKLGQTLKSKESYICGFIGLYLPTQRTKATNKKLSIHTTGQISLHKIISNRFHIINVSGTDCNSKDSCN